MFNGGDGTVNRFSNLCNFLQECQALNRAIFPDLQAMLIDQTKSSCFSTATAVIIKVFQKRTPSQGAYSTYSVHQSHQQLLVFLMLLIWAMARNVITWDNYMYLWQLATPR